MGEHHWKDSRRYAKADVYAVPEIRREYEISFAVACLYRTLCELCDYRNLIYIGSITELHELTGLGRRTIKTYLDELCGKKLVIELPKEVGNRQKRFDVSSAYSKLIVPNEETPWSRAKKAAKEQRLDPDRAPGASLTRQMTRPTWENTSFGGREAARREESEANSLSSESRQQEEWSSHPGQLFAEITQEWSSAQPHLERELQKLGLDPDGDWCEVSNSNGLDGQVVAAFVAVTDQFRDF